MSFAMFVESKGVGEDIVREGEREWKGRTVEEMLMVC